MLLMCMAGCQRKGPPPAPPPVPVEIARVATSPLRDSSEYLSILRSRRSVRLQPQVEGWVTAIHVSSGAQVPRGAPLVDIDPRRQQAAVASQAASGAAARAQLRYAEQQAARARRLLSGGGASRQEVEQAESALKSARAQVAASGAELRAQSVSLRYYHVTAPEAGTVGDIPIRIGDLVTTQTLLTTIDQNQQLEAYINVPVEQAARARVGTPVELLDDADHVIAKTQVAFVSPTVSPDQTVLVKAWVDNRDGKLRNTQLVRARLVWSERPAPVVPVLAVQTRNGQAFAWTVERGPKGGLVAAQRAIQVGPITGQSYPVLSGMSAGQDVIVSGVQKLRPGAPVKPQQPATMQGR